VVSGSPDFQPLVYFDPSYMAKHYDQVYKYGSSDIAKFYKVYTVPEGRTLFLDTAFCFCRNSLTTTITPTWEIRSEADATLFMFLGGIELAAGEVVAKHLVYPGIIRVDSKSYVGFLTASGARASMSIHGWLR